MIKRMIAMLLAVLMVLSLAGCGEQGLKAPNGEVLKETENYGVPVFEFAGTTIPVGLGLPQLTDEEIDALLEENDPRKAKETITTLADFVNYCYRGKFTFGDGLIFFFEENGTGIQTTSSGYQTLLRREGQCASMASCLHYVLGDDYEEVGYVCVDEHLMAYILCDGFYYLINPVDYAYYKGEWNRTWLGHLIYTETGVQPTDLVYCSEDFQNIADSIIGKEIGVPLTFVYTYTGPGDFLRIGFSGVPEGSNAKSWCGDVDVSYHMFTQYDWLSQENVVDEEAIVMYPSAEGSRVTFGGVHWDVDTDMEWETPADKIPKFTGEEIASVVEYFKEIGAITFTNTELTALVEKGDLDEISRVVTTAKDCAQLISASGIRNGDNNSIEDAFAKKILRPEQIVEMACHILAGDYEEVGMVKTIQDSYFFLYAKNEEGFLLCDVLGYSGWITSDPFESEDALLEYAIDLRNVDDATLKAWPW